MTRNCAQTRNVAYVAYSTFSKSPTLHMRRGANVGEYNTVWCMDYIPSSMSGTIMPETRGFSVMHAKQ